MKNSNPIEKQMRPPVFYPVLAEEAVATDYTLTVDGHSVFLHQARVSAHPMNQVWPGYQRPLTQTEIASFAAWDMSEPVEVVIVSSRPVQEVRVRPRSAGITPEITGNTIRFRVENPGQLTVEVNGMHQALHLFANPPEDEALKPNDPYVRYFGAGIHHPGLIRLESNQSVYIAAGAVVYGAIFAEKADHIVVRGRGILDGSKLHRMDVNGLVCFVNCTDVRLEGITLRDPSGWTIVPIACRQVHICNVKIIGNWRYNTDGIDFVNCQDCTVEDSFIRSFDDSIALKGYEKWGPFIYQLQILDGKFDSTFTVDGVTRQSFSEIQQQMGLYPCRAASIRNIHVRRCVLWNEWGRALEIGAETVAEEISNILFEDCDIIHAGHVAMDVQNCDRAQCHNIAFRNIRVEFDDDATSPQMQVHQEELYVAKKGECSNPQLIVLENIKGYCSYDSERGHITDIHFHNIEVTSWNTPASHLRGFDAEHLVEKVTIEGLQINGRQVTSLDGSGLILSKFVRDVVVR